MEEIEPSPGPAVAFKNLPGIDRIMSRKRTKTEAWILRAGNGCSPGVRSGKETGPTPSSGFEPVGVLARYLMQIFGKIPAKESEPGGNR